jgi:hypothetical protein
MGTLHQRGRSYVVKGKRFSLGGICLGGVKNLLYVMSLKPDYWMWFYPTGQLGFRVAAKYFGKTSLIP